MSPAARREAARLLLVSVFPHASGRRRVAVAAGVVVLAASAFGVAFAVAYLVVSAATGGGS